MNIEDFLRELSKERLMELLDEVRAEELNVLDRHDLSYFGMKERFGPIIMRHEILLETARRLFVLIDKDIDNLQEKG